MSAREPLFVVPLFIVIEPADADARAPARRIAWACADGARTADADAFADAARAIAAHARDRDVFFADPLFDAPRLAAVFAAAGVEPPPEGRDWLLALAPFGQARNLAAVLEAAAARADPANPAERLYEAWREARGRAQSDDR